MCICVCVCVRVFVCLRTLMRALEAVNRQYKLLLNSGSNHCAHFLNAFVIAPLCHISLFPSLCMLFWSASDESLGYLVVMF